MTARLPGLVSMATTLSDQHREEPDVSWTQPSGLGFCVISRITSLVLGLSSKLMLMSSRTSSTVKYRLSSLSIQRNLTSLRLLCSTSDKYLRRSQDAAYCAVVGTSSVSPPC